MNIAFKKPAMISSTCKWSRYDDKAQEALIGNNGEKGRNTYFHTAWELFPWWQVDLEAPSRIDAITIFNRLDQSERLKSFRVLVSMDGYNWSECYRSMLCTPFEELEIPFGEPQLARFVRIQNLGLGFLHLREIEISGVPQAGEDAATSDGNPSSQDRGEGQYVDLGGVEVFNSAKYPDRIRNSIGAGHYEKGERSLAAEFLQPDDRVLEVGTAAGAIAMTSALIVGPENVVTFDANPEIVEDARANFAHNGLSAIKSNVAILRNRKNYRADEMVDFFISKNFWASRLFARETATDIEKVVSIPTACLEDEIEEHGATALMCDIEGGEVDLLLGADLSSIRLIVIETHYWAVGEEKTDRMIADLIKQGFSIHLGKSGNHRTVLRRH